MRSKTLKKNSESKVKVHTDGHLVTKGEVMAFLDRAACRYAKTDIIASIVRNKHMNNYGPRATTKDLAEAVLVDFLNYVGTEQGLDYGMYVRDLRREAT